MTNADMKKKFKAFAEAVSAAGLKAVEHPNGHWRIVGGVNEINYYPFSKRRTIYINQNTARIGTVHRGTVAQAIEYASAYVGVRSTETKARRRPMKKEKLFLLKKNPFCVWCGKDLNRETATVEHIVPLSKGGTNSIKNLGLACHPCNQKRANNFHLNDLKKVHSGGHSVRP